MSRVDSSIVFFSLGLLVAAGSDVVVFDRLIAADKTPVPTSPEQLVKQLESAIESGNPDNVADLFSEPFAGELRKLYRLQNDLLTTHAELEEAAVKKFGPAPEPKNPSSGTLLFIRPVAADTRAKSMKRNDRIELLSDQSDQNHAVLRVYEKDDTGAAWRRTLIAERKGEGWILSPPKEVYLAHIIRPKAKQIPLLIRSFRSIHHEVESGTLTSRADMDNAVQVAVENYMNAMWAASDIWNISIPDQPPVRLLGLGYLEVDVTKLRATPPLRKSGQPTATADTRPARDRWRDFDSQSLIKELKNSDPAVREAAIRDLDQRGPVRVNDPLRSKEYDATLAVLTKLLDDPEPYVAEAALKGLFKIARP